MTNFETAFQYACDVVDGDVPACIYVRQACQRFLDDLERDESWRYVFDAGKAEHACTFIQSLRHTKGTWANQPLTLSPWQVFIVCNLFGWVDRETGLRRFRQAYIEVPRKNGKSLLAAAIGLYMFCAQNDFGAEVYSGAGTEKQAWEVFRPARQLCERMPKLRQRFDITVNAKALNIFSQGNRFEPIIGNPGDGASPSCAIVDEFHEHKTDALLETMVTGMGAREQPLLFIITTAGSNFGGPCFETRSEVKNILAGTLEDETVFGIIYTIDEDDDWQTVESLQKANPNYGISVYADFLISEMQRAQRSSSKQNGFKTKHLNIWVGAKVAWLNMLRYQACQRKKLALKKHHGRRAFVAVDLATKVDIASVGIVLPPEGDFKKWAAFCWHYLPEKTVEDGPKNYQPWADDGWLRTTPGEVTDFRRIRDDIVELSSQVEIQSLGYDPYQATQFATELQDDYGMPVVEIGQTVKNFSEPMKQMEALILQRHFEFQFDPVLLWMFGNVVAKIDLKENIFPNKEKKENKIDGVVALIMGLALALSETESGSSIYETTAL